jgi:6-phosphogluconolactonase
MTNTPLQIEVLPTAAAVAQKAAAQIAQIARETVAARGKFVFAVSGGRTPWQMLRALATEDVPWHAIHIAQVDERVAPAGDPARNLTNLHASLLEHAPIDPTHIHAMPVESTDLNAAAHQYQSELERLCRKPAIIDLIHLGLGPDGHTASLVPGDAVLNVNDVDVAMTAGLYQGRRRMTLTYPIINRARQILWIVTGDDKPKALVQLKNADQSIPAGRVNQQHATVLADQSAAELLRS